MVDDPAHLDVIDSVRSSQAVPVRVAIDVDAGLWVGGQHVGPEALAAARHLRGPRRWPGRSPSGTASGWSA